VEPNLDILEKMSAAMSITLEKLRSESGLMLNGEILDEEDLGYCEKTHEKV
jgi:hypothetical protein